MKNDDMNKTHGKVNKMIEDTKIFHSISETVKEMDAAEGHVQAEMHDGTVYVFSVYDGQRPAHLVLESLYKWAEENDEELRQRIMAHSAPEEENEETH